MNISRRRFLIRSAAVGSAAILPFYIGKAKPVLSDKILGHGKFKYRVQQDWGDLDPRKYPVKNCHEMVMDGRGRLIMIGDETKNNILMYDKSGKLLETWGDDYAGGHGLSIAKEGTEEFLFISDNRVEGKDHGRVVKTTLHGDKVMTIGHPSEVGAYEKGDRFVPTETAIASNGDIYVADGYGSQYVLQYKSNGEFVRKFGGRGDGEDQFATAHGVCIDDRSGVPTLLVTSRAHNAFKRFTMNGQYLETIFLPGAYVCRPVIDGDELYAGVCWSRLRYLNQTPNSGFVTILNKENKVISNPGGTKPKYRKGKLELMLQSDPLFNHCHDVCIDNDKNIYVCQWNANQTYPIKLVRV